MAFSLGTLSQNRDFPCFLVNPVKCPDSSSLLTESRDKNEKMRSKSSLFCILVKNTGFTTFPGFAKTGNSPEDPGGVETRNVNN